MELLASARYRRAVRLCSADRQSKSPLASPSKFMERSNSVRHAIPSRAWPSKSTPEGPKQLPLRASVLSFVSGRSDESSPAPCDARCGRNLDKSEQGRYVRQVKSREM